MYILASFAKTTVYRLAAFELALAGSCIIGIGYLRRNEKARQYLYLNWPSVSNTYYWTEDSISFGQLTGTRLRLSDTRRWAKVDSKEDSQLEAD